MFKSDKRTNGEGTARHLGGHLKEKRTSGRKKKKAKGGFTGAHLANGGGKKIRQPTLLMVRALEKTLGHLGGPIETPTSLMYFQRKK